MEDKPDDDESTMAESIPELVACKPYDDKSTVADSISDLVAWYDSDSAMMMSWLVGTNHLPHSALTMSPMVIV
jgi:hypothetical protein